MSEKSELKKHTNKILKARAKELKLSQFAQNDDKLEASESYYILELADDLIALAEDDVDEIQDELRITPIPSVSNKILGVINVRGKIVSVINLKDYIKFNASVHFERSKAKTIIIDTDEFSSGILVSDVIEKVTVKQNDIEIIESDSNVSEYVSSLINYQNKKVAVLDIRRVLKSEELTIDN